MDRKWVRSIFVSTRAPVKNRAEKEKAMATATKSKKSKKSKVKGPSDGSVIKREYPEGNCGDRLADVLGKFLKGEDGKIDPKKLAQVAKDNNVDMGPFAERNLGMQRMNLGNILRGKNRNGEKIVVGSTTVAGQKAKE